MAVRGRIALVVPNLLGGGGVPSVARFLLRAMEGEPDLEVGLISLATSASDAASSRIVAPRSWPEAPRVVEQRWEGRPVRHVGARFVELEFQRYRPRGLLSRLLETFDLVQVVAGSPAQALVARDFEGPVALLVATLAAVEREERAQRDRGPVGWWRKAMTRITHRMDRQGAEVADRIFVINAWMHDTLSSWIGPERVVLAPPGVDAKFFRPPEVRAPSGSRCGHAYVLSVGRFDDPRKNVRLLFEAFARLRHRLERDVKLVLAGETGPGRADRAHMRELGLEGAVVLEGKVSDRKLAELYREAELFVLSSTEEGLGIVLLEAMASGLPVVATRTEGARQVVEQDRTGLLVDLDDPDALASAMTSLLEDPDRRRAMGARARERIERHFSEEVAAGAFLDTYRALLCRTGGQRDLALPIGGTDPCAG